jgi:predicted methyltransferase
MKISAFKNITIALSLAVSSVCIAPTSAFAAASPTILTMPARPDADAKRDADRKPLEMVDFAMIQPGATIVDFLPGGGYFTRIFSAAAGQKGRVIAFVPGSFAARFPAALTGLKALAAEPGRENIAVASSADGALAPAGTVDVVWTSQNYHDLHNVPGDAAASVNKAAFAALKHGGYYVVLDHAAAAGSGLRDTNTLHRIDPAVVKAEVVASGFTFDGESIVLANADDNHTLKVFDPALRGHTDQFIYRFRKP